MISHKKILIQFLNIYFVQPFDDVIAAYQMEKTQIINHYPTLKSLSNVYWDKGLKGHYSRLVAALSTPEWIIRKDYMIFQMIFEIKITILPLIILTIIIIIIINHIIINFPVPTIEPVKHFDTCDLLFWQLLILFIYRMLSFIQGKFLRFM